MRGLLVHNVCSYLGTILIGCLMIKQSLIWHFWLYLKCTFIRDKNTCKFTPSEYVKAVFYPCLMQEPFHWQKINISQFKDLWLYSRCHFPFHFTPTCPSFKCAQRLIFPSSSFENEVWDSFNLNTESQFSAQLFTSLTCRSLKFQSDSQLPITRDLFQTLENQWPDVYRLIHMDPSCIKLFERWSLSTLRVIIG